MDRNSKKNRNLAKRIIVSQKPEHVSCNMILKSHSSRTQTPDSKQENHSNSWV